MAGLGGGVEEGVGILALKAMGRGVAEGAVVDGAGVFCAVGMRLDMRISWEAVGAGGVEAGEAARLALRQTLRETGGREEQKDEMQDHFLVVFKYSNKLDQKIMMTISIL